MTRSASPYPKIPSFWSDSTPATERARRHRFHLHGTLARHHHQPMRRPHAGHELLVFLRRLRRTRCREAAFLWRIRFSCRRRNSQARFQRLQDPPPAGQRAPRRQFRLRSGHPPRRWPPGGSRLELRRHHPFLKNHSTEIRIHQSPPCDPSTASTATTATHIPYTKGWAHPATPPRPS